MHVYQPSAFILLTLHPRCFLSRQLRIVKKIKVSEWKRKEHFENFIMFDDPFFNICADVEVTNLKFHCQQQQGSFFIHSYHTILRAVNSIEEFKTRIRGEEVVLHDTIHGSCTIMRDDSTFGYGYFQYVEDLKAFEAHANEAIAYVKEGKKLETRFDRDDLIHSSVIPWASFRSIEHAKRLNKGDCIPKIVTGRTYEQNGKVMMPVSVSGHHALMDGWHAGRFFQEYEQLCRSFSA